MQQVRNHLTPFYSQLTLFSVPFFVEGLADIDCIKHFIKKIKPLMKNCSVNKISIQELNVLTFKLVLFGPGFCHFSVL